MRQKPSRSSSTVRPREALTWNRPHDVHLGLADPRIPTLPEPNFCHFLDAGLAHRRALATRCRPQVPVAAVAVHSLVAAGRRSRCLADRFGV